MARVAKRTDEERGRRTSKRPRGRKYTDQDVLTAAVERVHHCFDLFDHVAVAFSGGKDSTVVLEVALQAWEERGFDKPLRVVFFDEEAIPYETEHYVRRRAEDPRIDLEWLCLPVRHRNGCSRRQPWWWPWAPEARDLWVRPLPPEAITDWPGFPMEPPSARLSAPDFNGLLFDPKLGRCGLLMGIRAEESIIRMRAVTNRQEENWIVPYSDATARGNVWKCYPVFDWRTTDVWTAIGQGGWDYNESYDLQEMMGLGHRTQRCAPPYGEEPMQLLFQYSRCFPDVWDKMAERVPGARTAARYARTALYDFHARRVLPDGETWPGYITQLIDRFPEEERAIVAEGIRSSIGLHYKHTSDPIMAESAHPATGVSWSFLASRAARGNFKRRRQPNGINTEENWAAYRAELKMMREEGRMWEVGIGERPEVVS